MRTLIILIFLLPGILVGQLKLDSILALIKAQKDDTTKVLLWMEAAEIAQPGNPDSSLLFLERGCALAERLNQSGLLADCLIKSGRIKFLAGRLDDAEIDFQAAIEISRIEMDSQRIYQASSALTVVYWKKGDLAGAAEQGLSGLPYEPDPRKHARLYNNLGGIFEEMDDDEKAMEYYGKSLEIHRANQDSFLISGTLGNLGVVHYNLGEYGKALELLQESIDLLRPFNHPFNLSIRLQNIGNVLKKMGNFSEAMKYFEEGLALSEEINDRYGTSSIANNIGETLIDMGNYTRARQFLDLSEDRAREVNSLQLIVDALYFKSQLAYKLGKYKESFDIQTEFIELKDSLFNETKHRTIQELESKYQKAQQENTIRQQDAQIAVRTSQRNLLIGATFFILLLAGISIYGLIQRNRRNKKIQAQENLIQQQKIKNLEKENKILALDAMVMGQEEERKRIAKDLHDGLGSLMATVKGHFSAIQNEIDKLADLNIYKKTDDLIDKACDEVRRISHNMMPKALIEIGLADAVRDLTSGIAETEGLQVEYEVRGIDHRLAENIEIMVFRIIQELLSNIVKHAGSKKVLVQLIRKDDNLHLTVEDDGKGFTLDKVWQKGLGLKSIHSRVEYLDGKIDIDSVPSEGTTVLINIPIKEKESAHG